MQTYKRYKTFVVPYFQIWIGVYGHATFSESRLEILLTAKIQVTYTLAESISFNILKRKAVHIL